MTHPDPHRAIGENIVQLRRDYDDATERGRANFLHNEIFQNTQWGAWGEKYISEPMVHVEPPLFDDMLSPRELMAATNVWLVRAAIFAAGWMVGCITAALMVGG